LWRYACEDPKPKREEAIERLVEMLRGLVKAASKRSLTLAPMIGVACPGVIAADGTIERGGQNLPGNWESSRFNLAERLREGLPHIGEHATHVVIHNDAVVQGLSEAPFMREVEKWAVVTIGTGLGNACFTNRPTAAEAEKAAPPPSDAAAQSAPASA
jgi:predicted NBD/HSP70 family sugar kinase